MFSPLPFFLSLLFLPTLFASPTPSSCAPTTYQITHFTLTPTLLSFTFHPIFPLPSLISDPSLPSPALCAATASNDTGVFPSEFTCSTGRTNLIVNVRGDKPGREYQVGHWWGCDGNGNWASSTKVVIEEGKEGVEVEPENVRRVPCGTPTCA